MNHLVELGSFNETAIVAKEVDGEQYVNATAMCKACGRRWNDYAVNDDSKAFLETLSLNTGIPVNRVVISTRGRYGGTWVHRRLAIDLARWLSPELAVEMNGWLDELLTTGAVQSQREVSEYQIAKIFGDAVGGALTQISETLANINAKIDAEREEIQDVRREVRDGFEELTGRVVQLERQRPRKAITKATRNTHISAVSQLGGRCPCCQLNMVVVDGKVTEDSQFDHYFTRNRSQLSESWLVCTTCNRDLNDQEFHHRAKSAFDAYQDRLKTIVSRKKLSLLIHSGIE